MKTSISREALSATISALRGRNPLVQNITNYVVMNNTANALFAIGASPIMAHSISEMGEKTAIVGDYIIVPMC